MMHFIRLATPVALLSLTIGSGVANAGSNYNSYNENKNNGNYDNGKKGSVSSVPELSIGAAGGALVILVGAALIARGRRRHNNKE